MARLHTRWNQPTRQRSFGDTASIMAINIWKLASDALLEIENEGFETNTYKQRLEVIREISAYALHLLDRILYTRMDDERRAKLVAGTAAKIVDMMYNNCRELNIAGVEKESLSNLLNMRGDEYADCRFHQDGPGFTLRRLFGEQVQKVLGERDNKWSPDYVLDIVGPQVYKELRRSLTFLLKGVPDKPAEDATTTQTYDD